MSSQLEDAFNEAVERRVADIRAHLLSQDTAEAMQLAIVNTHMEDKRPEMWASAAVYTSAALAVVSSALAASSADPLADENPEGGFEGLAAGEPRCAECVVNGWKNPHPAFSSQHRAWDDGRRLRAADPPASPDERLREALRDANEYLAQIADYSPSEVADAIDSVRAQIKDALAATEKGGAA